MTAIPEQPVDIVKDLSVWFELKEQIKKLSAQENVLRQRLFAAAFPTPVEGTNTYMLPDGYAFKAKHIINRKILEDLLLAKKAQLIQQGIPVDKLIRYTPDLVMKEFRQLTTEEANLFEEVIEAKPGMPQFEIVKPKR